MQSANCLRIVSQKKNKKSHEYKKNLIFDHLRQYIISGDNSLQSLCRACLCIKPQEMHPLLSSKDTTLAEMFTALTAIQVDLDDGLPMYICSNCRKSITNCYEFKTQCENANDTLKSILKEKVISAMEPTCINKGTAKPRKTKAEYQKAYRERQKAKKKENKQESTAKPRKTKAEYQKEYRERQKAKKKENKQKSTAKPPKTNAEHQKAFRERQKMKKIKNKRERTFIDVDIVCDGDQTIKKELDTEEIMEHSDCTVSETPESHELVSTEPDYLPSRNISERLVNEVENIYDNMEIVKEEQNIEEAIHHHLATVTGGNKENAFDSTLPTSHLKEEKISISSSDVYNTNSSYTQTAQDGTTSDESCLYVDKILDQAYSFGNRPHASKDFHQNNYSILEPKPLSDIEQPLNIESSTVCNDSILSDVSNSPGITLTVDSRLLKPASISTHKTNYVISGDNASIGINNHTQEDELINKDDVIIPKLQPIRKPVIRSKDYCAFCEGFVLNFARHLTRYHVHEPEVQKILSTPKKSRERKELIMALRKKGNFIQNSVEVTKPMRKQKSTDYLPCTNCLGFYSKKLLWKHKKKCTPNSNKSTINVQSEAQNLLLSHLKIDKKLKRSVFLRMRADKTSLVAKSDDLICAFGSQYMKTHREKHFVNVVSRKMRELAKLLQEITKINPSIKNLFSALRPAYYDTIVAATKVVGKYNSEKDRFESPAFAMNISTSIKQCCNIAILYTLRKQGPYMKTNTAEIEADLKTLIQIIDSNWKSDISRQAASDLNTNKWNKVTIIPLANDLKILKEYLEKKSEEAASIIKEGLFNVSTYIQLLETVYCRVLLLNRRRPRELQEIKVHDYLESDNNSSDKYEEFDRALTVSERVLVQKCKRVVIKGKRERRVLILFNKEVQEDIKLLLSIRDTFISTSYQFLFGIPGFENTIYGYKVLKRYAKLCGAKNPQAISSTRLGKHLATLSQIFTMSENDMEQLATFMGRRDNVHKKSYRLSDDVYQAAKISKLIILMEDGKADAFREKSLDEIELDLNEQLDEGMTENELILDYDFESPGRAQDITDGNTSQLPPPPPTQPGPSGIHTNALKSNQHAKKGKMRTLIRWTPEQKKVCTTFFKHHIINKQSPKKHECEALKEEHQDLLSNKDWLKIKVFIQNIYTKK